MGCLRRCSRADTIEFFNMIARRGHSRCHCKEEGFGTLSWQLGNDEGYRSSRAGVSGCFTRWPRVLLNYFVGSGQQRLRDGEAEGLGGLEVDDELELGGLHDREVGGLFALENPTSVDAGLA
jgi:hypothetical protein